jgi:hypothetical protein
MSIESFRRTQREIVATSRLAKTATASLTNAEVRNYAYIDGNHASVAIALTVPAASAANKGAIVTVVNKGAAAVTVVCAAGFGGGGAGTDTVTLSQGKCATVHSDGAYWYTGDIATSLG